MLFNKVDVRPLLRGHLATLRNNRFGNAVSRGDVAVFFVAPILIAATVVLFGFRFRTDAVNGFLNVFAILTGLLLNLLVLVLTLATSKSPQYVDLRKRGRLIKEIFANVCFAVLVAVVVVCVALVALAYMRSISGATTGLGATFLLASLTVNFVLTLLMVLKRMYILLSKELESDTTEQKRAA